MEKIGQAIRRLNRRWLLTLCGGAMIEQCLTRTLLPVNAQQKISTGEDTREVSSEKKKKEMIESAYELGFEIISKGKYPGCAICTLAAIQDTLNIRSDLLFKAASGFSGGGGLTGLGNCGSFTSGALVIGQLCGCDRENIGNSECYSQSSRIVALLADEFKREWGSFICRDIQTKLYGRYYDFRNKEDVEQYRKSKYAVSCSNVVGKGTQLAVKLILDEGLVKV